MKVTYLELLRNKIGEIIQNRNIWIFICLAFCIFFLRKKIDILISDYLSEPIFQHVVQDTASDAIIIIASLSIVVIYGMNIVKKRWLNKQYSFIIYLLGFIYILYRFYYQSSHWENYSFYSEYLANFFYTDLILLILAFQILNQIFVTYNEITTEYRLKNNPPKNNSVFHLGENKVDLTNRNIETERIADEILKLHNIKSFAIGINGKWGSGKTFFVERIKEKLDKNTTELIIIEFNPWRSQSPNNIIIDFFNSLRDELTNYSQLSKKIKKYTEQLSNIDSNNIIGIYQSLLGIDNSLEETYNEINRLIKKLNKKIVIIIDDVDRLDDKEALEVIRIIRNTANFHNTIFLVCYDKYYLNAIIKKSLTEYEHERFLEKIFQFEVRLSPFNPTLIKNQIYDRLTNAFKSKSSEFMEALALNPLPKEYISFVDEIGDEKSTIIKYYIKSFRDIDRFCNSFIYNFGFIGEEIVVSDFFFIELLRSKHPRIYDSIESIVKIENDHVENNFYQYYVVDQLQLDILLEKNPEDKKQTDIIKKTLNFLFNKNARGFRAINIPLNLSIYISNEIGKRVSVARYRNARRNGIERLKAFIDEEINDKKYSEVMQLLESNQNIYENKADVEVVLESIVYAISVQEKGYDLDFYNILDLATLNTETASYYNPADLKQKIIEIIEKYSPNTNVSNWLYLIIREYVYGRMEHILTIKDAQELTLNALKKHLEAQENIGIVEESLTYLKSCVDTIDKKSFIILLQEAKTTFRDFIELHPYTYLEHCIYKYSPSEDAYVLDGWIPQIFDSYIKFGEFLKKLDKKEPIVESVSNFYQLFEENGYTPIRWSEDTSK